MKKKKFYHLKWVRNKTCWVSPINKRKISLEEAKATFAFLNRQGLTVENWFLSKNSGIKISFFRSFEIPDTIRLNGEIWQLWNSIKAKPSIVLSRVPKEIRNFSSINKLVAESLGHLGWMIDVKPTKVIPLKRIINNKLINSSSIRIILDEALIEIFIKKGYFSLESRAYRVRKYFHF